MKILFFSRTSRHTRGGMETVLSHLSEGLAQRGHTVQTIYFSREKSARRGRRVGGGWEINLHNHFRTWYGLPHPAPTRKFLYSLQRLARILYHVRPDVVSYHYPGYCSIYFSLLKYLFGYKLIFTGHGNDLMRIDRRYDFHRRAVAFSFRVADHVTGVSQSICTRATELAPIQEKTIVIPNGIDWEFWSSSGGSRASAPRIVHVGSLREIKGQDVLIKAFARVLQQIPECRLVLVGEGRTESDLKELVQALKVEEYVDFMGWQRPEAIRRIFSESTIFAFPSRSEGLPLALLEAMAAGLPVIASRVGGIPEVVQQSDKGMLVPPEDEAALAEGLLAVLRDEGYRKQLSENARARARDFSWEATLDRYEKLFLEA